MIKPRTAAAVWSWYNETMDSNKRQREQQPQVQQVLDLSPGPAATTTTKNAPKKRRRTVKQKPQEQAVMAPAVIEPAVEPYLVGYGRRRRAHIADLIRQHAEDDAIHDQSGWTKWL